MRKNSFVQNCVDFICAICRIEACFSYGKFVFHVHFMPLIINLHFSKTLFLVWPQQKNYFKVMWNKLHNTETFFFFVLSAVQNCARQSKKKTLCEYLIETVQFLSVLIFQLSYSLNGTQLFSFNKIENSLSERYVCCCCCCYCWLGFFWFYTSVMRSHQLMTACIERNHQF